MGIFLSMFLSVFKKKSVIPLVVIDSNYGNSDLSHLSKELSQLEIESIESPKKVKERLPAFLRKSKRYNFSLKTK